MISEITEISDNKGWMEMWAISILVFLMAKVVQSRRYWGPVTVLGTGKLPAHQSRRDWTTLFAFMALWPGMDVAAFRRVTAEKPSLLERGAVNLILGGGLVWGMARFMMDRYFATWVCMIGFVIALHGGVFTLLTEFWRRRGRDVRPLMVCPAAAASVTEFWGKRWNVAFRDLGHQLIFRPMTTRFGPTVAMWSVFLFSGVVHELVITVPAGGGYGGPTAYFALQALVVNWERGCPLRKRSLLWRLRALVCLIVPLPLCFPAVFIDRVMTPFFVFLHAL